MQENLGENIEDPNLLHIIQTIVFHSVTVFNNYITLELETYFLDAFLDLIGVNAS